MSTPSYPFPDDFIWGAATASYQVEGAANEDGRGPSIWDTFSHTPGRVVDGTNGDVACDQYHLYPQDIERMKWLGIKAYRFSIAWPRIVPDGDGEINPAGLDHYDRLVDALLAAEIQPFPTLYHWDLPQSLQDRYAGWQDRRTAEAFGRYAGIVGERLGDRVKNFFTINEFSCFTNLSHVIGAHAPGLKVDAKTAAQIRHHAVLGHGLAVRALRQAAPNSRVGLADNPEIAVPIIETPEHIEAAGKAFRDLNGPFLTAVMEGEYPQSYRDAMGANMPEIAPGDMEIIGSDLDFVGMNMYAPNWIRAAENDKGFLVVPFEASYPDMDLPWLRVCPQITYWGPRHARDLWGVKELYITENGACCKEQAVTDDAGEPIVEDPGRVMYLRNHFINAQRAVREGVPLRGYFVWSLLDNFEWAEGYMKRFGLFYTDYETQQRIAKRSAHFYRATIAAGAVC